MTELPVGWFLSLLLGARHALEPDHVAAVTTMLTTERGRPAALGVLWGAGHALALFGMATTLSLLERQLSPEWADRCELLVGGMLIFLGGRAVILVLRALHEGRQGLLYTHSHGGARHVHSGPLGHVHIGGYTFAHRPLLVGLFHGLAGSGALTALVSTKMPGIWDRLAYVSLFGIGSMLGMGALAGLLGWPLSRWLAARPLVGQLLTVTAGILSMGLGVLWSLPIVDRLWSGS
ncbi:MAG: hypothetical protein U0787_07125 [Polyangia bacterium]|jgi:hypothetical protein